MSDDTTDFNRSSEPDELPDDPRVVEVLEDYLREVQSGSMPDRRKFENRYPELAAVVAKCLDGLDILQGSFPPSGSGSGRVTDSTANYPPRRRIEDRDELASSMQNPLGDFQIVRELARGGMGVVYEAVQLSLGRRVALKVLPFAATVEPRRLQRFKLEAQAAALLHHTHIVPIYAVGCERGVHFYAMQLIEGQSLAVVIQQLRAKEGKIDRTADDSASASGGSRPSAALQSTANLAAALTADTQLTSETYIRRAAQLMVQAAEALEHAHQAGVVHRDIKPANCLLDAAGNLWITDFGLAQLQADNGLTRSGDMLGTFRYMSPEQTAGQRTMLDHRTDIYSLGATFYELLTLEPAFSGETHHELLYQILHTEPRSLRELNRAVPVELEIITLKALSKNPADRYRTAADFAADIRRYLDHQPILARRPSVVDRVRKWSRRHPAVAVAAGLLLLVITVGSLISNRLIAVEQQRTAAALEKQKERFNLARRAVDELFQISEEELSNKPADPARRRILEIVLSQYQEFIDESHDDPATQAELAQASAKVDNILRELNLIQREIQRQLLNNPSVQADLKLSPDTASKLNALLSQWLNDYREEFDRTRQLSEEERRSSMGATAERHEKALTELLTAGQLNRFKQISLQVQGIFAFKEPDVVKALQLTSEQRSKIRAIEHESFVRKFIVRGPGGQRMEFSHDRGPEMRRPGEPDDHGPGGRGPDDSEERRPPREPGPGGPGGTDARGPRPFGGDVPENRGPGGPPPHHDGPDIGPPLLQKQAVDHEEVMGRVRAVLTNEQLEKWREMTGEPFQGDGDVYLRGGPFGPRP